MQTNPNSSIPPIELKPEADLEPNKNSHDENHEIIQEQDETAQDEISTDFQEKKQSNTGIWNNLKVLFSRYFSPITPPEYETSKQIKLLITQIKRNLDHVMATIHEAWKTEKKFSTLTPLSETIETGLKYQNDICQLLATAQKDLIELKEKENSALELAKNHTAFSSLPNDIHSLDQHIYFLEDRTKVSDQLLDLEKTISDYLVDRSWENFTLVNQKVHDLAEILKERAQHNTTIKDDKKVQKYLHKDELNFSETFELMKLSFPGLHHQTERLFDHIYQAKKQRINYLNHKIEEVKPLFLKYREEVKNVNKLENKLYNPNWLDKIYRFFHVKEKLIEDLNQAKNELKSTHDLIKAKENFTSEEISWVMHQSNSDLSTLKKDLQIIQSRTLYIDKEKETSHLIDSLEHFLNQYQANLSALQEDKDSKTLEFIDNLQNKVHENIKALYESTQEAKLLITNTLPLELEGLSPLEQFKTVICHVFPNLKDKTLRITELIKKQNMQTEFNENFQKSEISIK